MNFINGVKNNRALESICTAKKKIFLLITKFSYYKHKYATFKFLVFITVAQPDDSC
jgi:hypothetical protein